MLQQSMERDGVSRKFEHPRRIRRRLNPLSERVHIDRALAYEDIDPTSAEQCRMKGPGWVKADQRSRFE